MHIAWQWLLVMIAMFITDMCWTMYLLKVESRHGVQAGLYATTIYLLGAFVVTSYVENKTLIIPALIGSFLGTWLTVEYRKQKEKQNPINNENKI